MSVKMNKEEKLLELDLERIVLDLVCELDYNFYKDLNPETYEDEEVARNKIRTLTEMLRKRLEDLKLIPSRSDT